MKFIESINEKVEGSFVGKYFQLKERGSSFSTELAGASATFLTMAYILAVNPRILADSGGPCEPNPDDPAGIFGQDYEDCLERIKRQYVTATAIGSMVGCLLMGLVANLPIALAPGMGMNAYFTYSVVGWRGTGSVSYQAACTAVIIEGAIFFVLALTGLRYKIIRLIRQHVLISRITDDFSRFVDVQSTRNAWHLFSIFSLLPTLLVWETPSWTPPAAKATERAQKCIVESMDGESEARAATKNEVQIDSKALSFEEMMDNLFQGARANVNDDGKQKQKKQRMSLARAQAKAQAHANGLVHALAAPLPVHGAHKETTHIQSSTQFR